MRNLLKTEGRRLTARQVIIGSLLVSTSLSFTAAAREEEDDTSVLALEEIVVTAQKRAENLQSVPIAVTAFSAGELERGAFNNIIDIAQQVPGLSINTHFANANPKIYLRGVGNNEYQANAVGAVAVYQDGVYLAAASGQLFQFFDLEAVEVLRGPQGTLYGKNTTGGAIGVRSKRPDGTFTGDFSVSVGNFNALDIEGGFSFPIVEDVLAARISVVSNNRDGTIENTFLDEGGIGRNNNKVNDIGSNAFRVLAVFTPSDELTVDFNYHRGRNRSTSLQGEAFALEDIDGDGTFDVANGFFFAGEDPDPYIQSYNFDLAENLDASGGSIKLSYDFGNLNLLSISATEHVARDSREDVDQSPIPLLEINWNNRSRQYSQELQLSNTDDSTLQWIVGGYYFTDEIVVANIYDLARVAAPNNLLITQNYDQDTYSYAAFGQGTYAISEQLNFTLGLRYSDETRKWTGVSTVVNIGLDTIPQRSLEEDYSNLSWRLALDYQFDEDMLVYMSVNRGYKAGGFNGGAVSNVAELIPYDEEKLTAYEIGFKSDLYDNRVRLNVAAFYYDYQDIQIFALEPPIEAFLPVPAQVIRNADSAETYGIELELKALVSERLNVSFNASYLHTEIGPFVTPVGNFEGNEIGNSPSYDISAAFDYTLPVSSGEVTFHMDVTATAERFFDPSNSERLREDGYAIFNSRLTYQPDGANWALTLWVKNLTDKFYYTEIIPIDGFGFDERFTGEQRTFGAKVRYNF